LNPFDPTGDLLVTNRDQPGENIAVAAEKFGGAMDRHIDSKIEGALQQRSHKGVVEQGQQTMIARQISHCAQVGNFEQGIGRSFQKQRPRRGRMAAATLARSDWSTRLTSIP
jgi:hypothetical protein